jgi:hypothetical protein
MFGYSNDLRSMTQGKGTFSMEFLKYQKVPSRFQEEIVRKAAKATAKADASTATSAISCPATATSPTLNTRNGLWLSGGTKRSSSL